MAESEAVEKWEVAHFERDNELFHVTKLRRVEIGEIEGVPYRRVLSTHQLGSAIIVPPKGHPGRGAAIAALKATPHGPPVKPPQIQDIEDDLNA